MKTSTNLFYMSLLISTRLLLAVDETVIQEDIKLKEERIKNYFKENDDFNKSEDANVLYHLEGVSLSSQSGPLSENQIVYRGLNTKRLRINIEGINLNNPSLGITDGNSLFLFAAQNVQIDGHKLTIKIPQYEEFKAKTIFGYGSFNTVKFSGLTSGPIFKDQNAFFAAFFGRTDGNFKFGKENQERKNNEQQRLNLIGKYNIKKETFKSDLLITYNSHKGGIPGFTYSPTDNLKIENQSLGTTVILEKKVDKTKFSFENLNTIFKHKTKNNKNNTQDILSSSHEFNYGLKRLFLPSWLDMDFTEQFLIENDYEHKKNRMAIGLIMNREARFQGRLKPKIVSDFSFWGYSEHGLLSKSDISIGIEPLNFLSLQFRFIRSQRLPTFMELYATNEFFEGNPNLQKESIMDFELSSKINITQSARLNIATFFGYLQNTIVVVPYRAHLLWPINADTSYRKGIDLGMIIEPNQYFLVESKNSLLHSSLKNTKSPLPNTPLFSGIGKIRFGKIDKIYSNIQARYKTKSFADIHQTLKSDGYVVFDLNLGGKPHDLLTLSLNIDNLFNKKDLQDSYQMPLPGLSFFAQMEIGNI